MVPTASSFCFCFHMKGFLGIQKNYFRCPFKAKTLGYNKIEYSILGIIQLL